MLYAFTVARPGKDRREFFLKLSSQYREDGPPPILESYWPGRQYRFIFRNWTCVPVERLARVLEAKPPEVQALADSMGLERQPADIVRMAGRGYITIIRRCWHDLPFRQLIDLLGWTDHQFFSALKEDDFLWQKLGSTKPSCPPLLYSHPTPDELSRSAVIREIVEAEIALKQTGTPHESRFDFCDSLCSPVRHPPIATTRNPGDGEVCLTPAWGIAPPGPGSGPASFAIERFRRFLSDSFSLDLTAAESPPPASSVLLTLDSALQGRPESHRIHVTENRVEVIAADEQGIVQGLERLKSRMKERRAPILRMGKEKRDTQFWPRFLHSYFGLYGDPLMDPDHDPFPKGYLERLLEMGVNGLWLQGVLWTLAPSPRFPEFGEGWQTRVESLNRMAETLAQFGMGLWLYLNEPRAMPDSFFEQRPELAGVRIPSFGTALCTSAQPVQEYLLGAAEHLGATVPGLAGVYTISGSENLTHCYSRTPEADCVRCGKRPRAEIYAEVNHLLREGLRRGNPDAHFIAWDWGWPDEDIPDILAGLPGDVTVQSVSEWGIPIRRGGIDAAIGEYALSVDPPGPRATRTWQLAGKKGLSRGAKIQINTTWELGSVPYLPAESTLANHMERLREAGIGSLMLGWTLGGCPSPHHEVAKQFYFDEHVTAEESLDRLARRRFGKAAGKFVIACWSEIREALFQYPHSVNVLYDSPTNSGAACPLYEEPTGYRATMIGLPYDDIASWCPPYPPQILADQFASVARGAKQALQKLEGAIGPEAGSSELDEEIRMIRTMQCVYQSTANQCRFVLLRDELQDPGRSRASREILDELETVLKNEINVARLQRAQAEADSRIGFEASNHYLYLPTDLTEKVINCRWLLDQWIQGQREALQE